MNLTILPFEESLQNVKLIFIVYLIKRDEKESKVNKESNI